MRSLVRSSILACALCAQTAPLSAAEPTVRYVGSARLENVPPIPPAIAEAVQRYQNVRAALFEDWSADGSMLIATRFGQTQQIHRVSFPGGARVQQTFFPDPAAAAWAIPRTTHFIAMHDAGGDEWFQLTAIGLDDGPKRLTEAGTRNQSAAFSKDGTQMLWSQAVKGSAQYAVVAANPLTDEARRRVYQHAGAVAPTDVSEDGAAALLLRYVSNRESEILLLDVKHGKARKLAAGVGPVSYENPKFAHGGRSVIALSDRDSNFRRVIELDVASGRFTVLTPDLTWDVEAFTLSTDGRLLAYAVNEDGYTTVAIRDLVTRRALPQPTLPRGVLRGMRFSPDSEQLAVGLTTATTPGDVWTWRLKDERLVRWTHSEVGGLNVASLLEPQLIRFSSFDGESIPAFIYRPHAASAATSRTPVIIDIHGGPESQSRPGWNAGAQYFADVLGATVILPNVRGSDGYGRRYRDLDNAAKREDSVGDIGALLDWIAKQPDLDAQRVAVYGQSYGGYMALASMTHYADRLVGGVERYGISDFATFLENTEAYRRDNRRGEYGDERDPQMRKVFSRISPLANVRRITKPMLVMQGANDPRVPQSESDQVVAEIRKNGAEVWYVVFADEGHGFLKKQNNDLRREVETVFLRRLFGQPLHERGPEEVPGSARRRQNSRSNLQAGAAE